MFAKLLLTTLSLIAVLGLQRASAAEVDDWKYRGTISWQHPDGRIIKGRYANTKVDDHRLSVIRSSETGNYYIQFSFKSLDLLTTNGPFFFINDMPRKQKPKRVKIGVSPRVWSDRANDRSLIVAQLSRRDLRVMARYNGNMLGATYNSVKSGEVDPRNRSFLFVGRGLSRSLRQLGYSGGGGIAVAPQVRRPGSASRPRTDRRARGDFDSYTINFRSCTRPPKVTRLATGQNQRANRYTRITNRYRRCRYGNSRRNMAALQDLVRSQGGEFTRANGKITYKAPRGCNCGVEFKAMVRNNIKRINAYVRETNRRLGIYDNIIKDRNRRVRRSNRADRYSY
ncbi:MAG: hypothetical protein AAGI12_05360 [Pseudomonadota bacterium]